ncbi:carbohydrate ABC transporter permease [Curtobacterium sp. L1-20]|uniref:carbohydrate ABC transporter permease n=1 Tax=Curtobacterium sp. L1-20 TaxID=3138181 RepID=UPI003B519F41
MTATSIGRGADKRPARHDQRGRSRYGTGSIGLAFIAPAFLGLAALYLWPLIGTIGTSFTKTGPFGGGSFTGAENYSELFSDPEFWAALRNSAVYTVIVLFGIPLAIGVSYAIHTVARGRSVYRVLYFLPVVTLPVAVGMVWRYIYNGDYGLLNQFLGTFGISGPAWVADPHVAIFAVSVVGIWMGLGTNIIILGAGLQGIPPELLEASSLDGAGRVRQFFSITLPLLTPSVFFVAVLSVISSLQMFDLIYVMIGQGSPALDGSETVVYLFYKKAFIQYNQGYGSALALVLLAVIILITAVQFRLQKKWVFYG